MRQSERVILKSNIGVLTDELLAVAPQTESEP
jgi:hypothetical protein